MPIPFSDVGLEKGGGGTWAYRVSTVLATSRDVQFSGQETCTSYSQVPFVTFQYAMLGRIVDGKGEARGWKDHAPRVDRFDMVFGGWRMNACLRPR